MTEQKKVKIGFIGVGYMGQCAHLKNYVVIPDCEIVAIAEIQHNRAQKVATKYAIPKVYNDYNEMLKKEELDAIIMIQPFGRHGILLTEILQYKKPVFFEKPLASSIETGEKIIEEMHKNNTWCMVGYHKRSDPAVMYAKQEIEKFKKSGEIGNMRYIRITMPPGNWIANGFWDVIPEDEGFSSTLKWDTSPSDMDEQTNKEYRGFVNYYIHQVNMMRHLLGEKYKVKYADHAGILLIGESNTGITGEIEMAPYSTFLDWQESVLVCFEKGWIKIKIPAPLAFNRPGKVEIFKDAGDNAISNFFIPQLPWVHAMKQQAMNFISAVKGETKPMCTAEEALEDLKIAREYIKLWKGK